MKYNRSEIMTLAWNIRRKSNCTMSKALKTAWAAIKAVAEAKEEGELRCGYTRTYMNLWENYGKSRIYCGAKVYTNGRNLKKDIKKGYIDNANGEWVAA